MNSKNNELPEGVLKNAKPYILQGQNFLIINDLHIPYHCKKSIDKALQIGKQNKVDTILLNGDIIDFFTISRFNKTPDNPNIQNEINTTLQILRYIRKEFPKAIIYYHWGNHEERLTKYINDHSELFSLDCLKLNSLLKFSELNIREIDGNTVMRIGDLFLNHGHTTNASGLTPAKNMLNKWHTDIAFGHLHRTDEFHFRKFDGTYINTYSIGCLCNVFPDYWAQNNWNHGCMIVKRLKDGKYSANNIRF